jgi:hypothetical protein
MNSYLLRCLANGITLSSEQQEILVGTILGDGHLVTSNNGRTFSLKLEHAFSQKDYIDWLYMKLESLVLTRPHFLWQFGLWMMVPVNRDFTKLGFSILRASAKTIYEFYRK